MKFKLTKTKLAAAITAGVMLVPATAYANHVFDDVADGAFYAGPVEWAFDNGITTGKSPTQFAPLDSVTRGESVTFLQRYNDNVVEPMTMNLFAADSDDSPKTNTSASEVEEDLGLSATVEIPEGHTGMIEVTFAAESLCTAVDPATFDYCGLHIYNNGSRITPVGLAIDSTDNGTASITNWESHAVTRVTADLPAGSYEITVTHYNAFLGGGSMSSYIDDATLTAQVHLTS